MQTLSNAAVPGSFSDILIDLGSVPLDRIHHDPAPGKATFHDLLRVNARGGRCELVDGTLDRHERFTRFAQLSHNKVCIHATQRFS